MAVGNYPAGTIRYINYTGEDGKIYTKKQKYYWLKLSIQNDRTWSDFASIYKETWVTGVGGFPHPPYYSYIKDYSSKFKLDYLPDASIKLKDTTFLNYVKENTFDGNYYTFVEIDKRVNNLYNDSNEDEGFGDYIDGVPDGVQFNARNSVYFAVGESYVFGWAELIKKSDSEQTAADAPKALDNDWTLEQVEEKIKDLQLWSDNNLLPPIFGPTNCVYFPSDLGSTKPDKPNDTNPIIKSCPFRGNIGIQPGDSYEYYGMDYPVSSLFQQIKCQKDEWFTINCNFPYLNTQERFDLIQDDYLYETTDDNSIAAGPPRNKTYLTFQSFKVNQIVEIRFIQPDAVGQGLTNELLFNKYKMQAIITQSDVPIDTNEDLNAWTKKYSISFKFINDLGLKPDEYFNAKVVVIGFPVRNYLQNETYCIKRYYNKVLGLGPRLGGSVMLSHSNSTEGDYNPSGLYLFSTVLKDEEKLNKPYENVIFKGSYQKLVEGQDFSIYDITHNFSKEDLSGKFVSIGSYNPFTQLKEIKDKKYIYRYQSYLIKNLDNHTYEYYQELNKSSNLEALFNFRESNENANLTFGSYE